MRWLLLLVVLLTLVTACDVSPRKSRESELATDQIAKILDQVWWDTDVKDEEQLCREAEAIGRRHPSPRAQAQVSICFAALAYACSDFSEAWRKLQETRRVSGALEDPEILGHILTFEGAVLSFWGLFDQALERFIEVQRRVDPLEHRGRYISAIINRSIIEAEVGDLNASLRSIIQAQQLSDPEKSKSQANIINNKAATLLKLERFEEALADFRIAREIAGRESWPVMAATTARGEGKALVAVGLHDEAERALQESLAFALEAENKIETASTHFELAVLRQAQGRSGEALDHMRETVRIAEQVEFLSLAQRAHRALSEELSRQGSSAAALDHFRRFSDIQETVMSQESRRRLDGLRIFFEVELLGQDLEELSHRQEAERTLLAVSIVGSLLLCSLLIGLFRRYRKERLLTARIRSDHDKLQRLNKGLVEANWRELEQVRRAMTLGQMAAAFAHELRQPLTAITTNAQAARRSLPTAVDLGPIVVGAVDDIVESSRRAQEIIHRLRHLMRDGESDRKPMRLNAALREIEGLLVGEAEKAECELQIELAPLDPLILGDRISLQQLVLNLVQNGLDANRKTSRSSTSLWVRTRVLSAEQKIALEVEDRGPAVAEDLILRMFEPLYTTKKDGMGMGLALCRAIAEAHDTKVTVSRNPEAGLTFQLFLKIVENDASSVSKSKTGVVLLARQYRSTATPQKTTLVSSNVSRRAECSETSKSLY